MRGACGGGIASFLALALLCLFHTSCLVDGLLKCHCDICTETNHTCETDGYCFASTSLENDAITYARRCYDKGRFFPAPDYSVWCSPNNTLRGQGDVEYVVACCDHADYCNRDLRPSFPPRESRGGPYSRATDYLGRGTASALGPFPSKVDSVRWGTWRDFEQPEARAWNSLESNVTSIRCRWTLRGGLTVR